MSNPGTYWKNWLPSDAVVMARRPKPQSEVRVETQEVPLVFITEPWAQQDPEVKPLLSRMIQAMGLTLEHVEVIENNDPDLLIRIQNLRPKAVVALGGTVAQSLQLEASERGNWTAIQNGTPVMPTWDLQALLKNQSAKKETWADLQKVMKRLTSES